MSKQGRRRYHKNTTATSNTNAPPEALCLLLTLPDTTQLEQLPGCPVTLGVPPQQQEEQHAGQQCQPAADELNKQPQGPTDQQHVSLQMEAWSQVPLALSWFSTTVLQQQPKAKLSFPACLSKDMRADVHNHVSKKLSKLCQSISEGLAEQRYVAVVAKGSAPPVCRRITGEQQDHAMALWLLWKQHIKAQHKQQKQQEQEQQRQQHVTTATDQPQHTQEPPQQHNHHQQQETSVQSGVQEQLDPQQTPEGASTLHAVEGLTLQDSPSRPCEADSSGSKPASEVSSTAPDAAAAAGGGAATQVSQRVYSRDEIGQMLVEGALTDELRVLWEGPQGVQQRAVRLLCLEAAAGDLDELQELLISHPQLVPSGVVDLSAGGALPLHLAAAGGYLEVVRALLAAGAPLEATDGKGQTALQVAQRSEQCDVEAVLLQAGAVNKQKDSWASLELKGGYL